ncbi:MAG: hypothetical protein KGL39_24800 [Patescibacteria group bacterium]|nr:hypothetical protein [Patescibacteria group bacterium]
MRKTCPKCGQEKNSDADFSPNRRTVDGLQCWCKTCRSAANREFYARDVSKSRKRNRDWRRDHLENYLFGNAKARARTKGLSFDIELSDIIIPDRCPYLGLLLKPNSGVLKDNSPSLDRIDPTKGYIKGNVEVISCRANTIKNSGTADEHLLIGKRMKQLEKKSRRRKA